MRRYSLYAEEGQRLDGFVEFTLKDDQAGDPPINKDGLIMLGILTEEEYDRIKALTKQIADLIRQDLALKQMELYDLKLEFGRVGEEQEIAVIDEISGGNMRVYHNGRFLDPIELAKRVLES